MRSRLSATVRTPWSLSKVYYSGLSFNYAPTHQAIGFDIKPDGTKLYLLNNNLYDIYQYTLSTAWDVSTASYDSVTLDLGVATILGVIFKTDGTRLYATRGGTPTVRQYSLSTAWDLSTAAYDSVALDISGQDTGPQGIFFKPDGLKFFLTGAANDSIYQYSLTGAWDLSTASYDSVSLSVTARDTTPREASFSSDGKKMFFCGSDNEALFQYSLSTAWDLSTATYDSVSLSLSSVVSGPTAIRFSSGGDRAFINSLNNKKIYLYAT